MNQIEKLYRNLINQWMKQTNINSFCQTFYLKIQRQAKIMITSDSRIINIFLDILQNPIMEVFSQKDIKYLKDRDRMFEIIGCLYKRMFINRKEYYQIKFYQNIYTINKIHIFLESVVNCTSSTEILQLWMQIMAIQMEGFWDLMYKKQIKDYILYQLYQEVKNLQNIQSNNFINNFIKQVFQKEKQRKENIKMTLAFKKKLMKQKPQQNEGIQKIKTFQKFGFLKQIKSDNPVLQEKNLLKSIQPTLSKIYVQQSKKQNQQFKIIYQSWFSQIKLKKFQKYLAWIRENQSPIECLLNNQAYQYSLFYNRKHKTLLTSIFKAIIQITNRIQHNSVESFQLFGSLRSTLALSNSVDIDITSILSEISRRGNRSLRERYVNVLFSLKKQILNERPHWLKDVVVYYFQKLPMPFLKIMIEEQLFQEQFPQCKITKVDITAGNQSAIHNSNLIEHFAQNENITLFCLLVKLWAKARNIINSKSPMRGLSSYGIIMMCIYYLMQTKQLNFIQHDVRKPIQHLIYPQIDPSKLKPLQQNFTNFLQFYKQTGIFQKEYKTVCLLKDFNAQQFFDHDVIINMYDFIDKTSPGRLKQKDHLFSQIKSSLKIMQSNDIDDIKNLFKE